MKWSLVKATERLRRCGWGWWWLWCWWCWWCLLSPETWQCNRPRISLKTSIDVPMLGDIIEQNGDGLLEESHMPAGWPLHIDGAVRQRCIHQLDDLLSEYDMKRDLAEINRKAPWWSHKAVWNKWYMEPKASHTLSQMWINAQDSDLRRWPQRCYFLADATNN